MKMSRKPTSPGEIFYFEFYKVNPKMYSRRINKVGGFPADFVNRFKNNDLYVDEDLAQKLSLVTGATPGFWLGLQLGWDQWHSDQE